MVRFAHQCLVIVVGPEAWVNTIVVGSGIAVIRAVLSLVGRAVVFKQRSEPQRRHTQLLEVVQVLSDALDVASVPQAGLVSVAQLVAHTLHNIVFRVAIGKSVGHEHVQHVGIGEAFAVFALHGSRLDGIHHALPPWVKVSGMFPGLAPLRLMYIRR